MGVPPARLLSVRGWVGPFASKGEDICWFAFDWLSHSSCMKSCLHKCHPSEFLLAVFFGNAIVLYIYTLVVDTTY